MTRQILLPLVPLYAAATGLRNVAYDRGWAVSKKLEWPVVSLGNLSVGGSGKTPLVIRLAELLASRGLQVDVLSRGYGRTGTETKRVDPNGTAAEFGDEPLLIARRTGIPVYVAASRIEAGRLAEAQSGSGGGGMHLLDDGFQHRKLARDVDIVVMHSSDFGDCLLPAGRLREPLGSLGRATFVVLREEDAGFEGKVSALNPAAGVWCMRRELDTECRAGTRALAFCGIARPEGFFAQLREREIDLVRTEVFPDHHVYSCEDVQRLAQIASRESADVFITTEKDAVKLNGEMQSILRRRASLEVTRLSVRLRDEDRVLTELLARIELSYVRKY